MVIIDSKPPILREILLTIVFGLSAPFIWALTIGLVLTHIDIPLMKALSGKINFENQAVVYSYILFFRIFDDALAAIIISVPYAFLLRYKYKFFYGIFLILAVSVAFISFLGRDISFSAWILSSISFWFFLFCCGCFIKLTIKLKVRR